MSGKKSQPAPAPAPAPAAVVTPVEAKEPTEQNRFEGRASQNRGEGAETPQLLDGSASTSSLQPDPDEEARKRAASGALLTG